jgi:hypothetical protein
MYSDVLFLILCRCSLKDICSFMMTSKTIKKIIEDTDMLWQKISVENIHMLSKFTKSKMWTLFKHRKDIVGIQKEICIKKHSSFSHINVGLSNNWYFEKFYINFDNTHTYCPNEIFSGIVTIGTLYITLYAYSLKYQHMLSLPKNVRCEEVVVHDGVGTSERKGIMRLSDKCTIKRIRANMTIDLEAIDIDGLESIHATEVLADHGGIIPDSVKQISIKECFGYSHMNLIDCGFTFVYNKETRMHMYTK